VKASRKKEKEPTANEQQRYERRRAVVEAVLRGEPIGVVARVFRVAMRSVFDWLSWYRQGGWHALKEGRRSGRPRKVSAEVMRWLYDAVTLGNPLQYQFEFCLWTLGIIREMLRREHGIELSKSSVSRLLAHLGLSPQRPLYKSYKQDPAALERYLKREFPELREEARRKGAVIFFVDEAAIRSDSHRGTTWGKIGTTPVVLDSGERFGLRLISAVSPRGDMRFASFEGRMTSARFVDFIRKLRSDVGRPIIVIADNASYHTGKPVTEYCEQSGGEVVVHNLPAYAPELNPDEQVWNHAKAKLSRIPFITRKEMKRAALSVLRSIQANTKLILSFFRLKDTEYAAAY
jgi:transposase